MQQTESFGPDKFLVGFWVLLSGVPVPIAMTDIALGRPGGLELFAVSLVVPAAIIIFTARFRATFTSDRFIYRRWGPTIEVPYRDLAHIEVTNVTPLQESAVGAFLITRDGRRLPFWPKLFPARAVARFFELAPRRV